MDKCKIALTVDIELSYLDDRSQFPMKNKRTHSRGRRSFTFISILSKDEIDNFSGYIDYLFDFPAVKELRICFFDFYN